MTASAVQKPADAHIRMLLKTLQIFIALKWSYDVYMVSKKFNILTFFRLLARAGHAPASSDIQNSVWTKGCSWRKEGLGAKTIFCLLIIILIILILYNNIIPFHLSEVLEYICCSFLVVVLFRQLFGWVVLVVLCTTGFKIKQRFWLQKFSFQCNSHRVCRLWRRRIIHEVHVQYTRCTWSFTHEIYTLHDPHFKMCWVPSADYFNIIMTKFMINNRTDAWICWIDSGFAFIRSRIIDSTWIDFKMASRFSMLRNMAFRRNLRPICQLVRRSFVGKDTTISKLCIINIFWFIEPTSRHKKPCSMFMFGEQGRKFQKGWLMIVKHNFNWSVFYLPNWQHA